MKDFDSDLYWLSTTYLDSWVKTRKWLSEIIFPAKSKQSRRSFGIVVVIRLAVLDVGTKFYITASIVYNYLGKCSDYIASPIWKKQDSL
jgi:hypothetical protein